MVHSFIISPGLSTHCGRVMKFSSEDSIFLYKFIICFFSFHFSHFFSFFQATRLYLLDPLGSTYLDKCHLLLQFKYDSITKRTRGLKNKSIFCRLIHRNNLFHSSEYFFPGRKRIMASETLIDKDQYKSSNLCTFLEARSRMHGLWSELRVISCANESRE